MKVVEERFEEIKQTIENFFAPLECVVELQDYRTKIGFAVVKDGETIPSGTRITSDHILANTPFKLILEEHSKKVNSP